MSTKLTFEQWWDKDADIHEILEPKLLAQDAWCGRNAEVSQLEARVRELLDVLSNAYMENQNLHCCTTISPKIGWDALNRQTELLRAALSTPSLNNGREDG